MTGAGLTQAHQLVVVPHGCYVGRALCGGLAQPHLCRLSEPSCAALGKHNREETGAKSRRPASLPLLNVTLNPHKRSARAAWPGEGIGHSGRTAGQSSRSMTPRETPYLPLPVPAFRLIRTLGTARRLGALPVKSAFQRWARLSPACCPGGAGSPCCAGRPRGWGRCAGWPPPLRQRRRPRHSCRRSITRRHPTPAPARRRCSQFESGSSVQASSRPASPRRPPTPPRCCSPPHPGSPPARLGAAIFHHFKDPVLIVDGKMQYLFDEKGRRYLDVSEPAVEGSEGGSCSLRPAVAPPRTQQLHWAVPARRPLRA